MTDEEPRKIQNINSPTCLTVMKQLPKERAAIFLQTLSLPSYIPDETLWNTDGDGNLNPEEEVGGVTERCPGSRTGWNIFK